MIEATIAPTVAWLIEGARSAPRGQDVVTQLCERLVAAGLPLWRGALYIRPLHPQLRSRSYTWRLGQETVIAGVEHQNWNTREVQNSPMWHVYHTKTSLRRKLADPDCPMDFMVLAEFRAEGITDYLVQPIVFGDGDLHAVTWATREPGGFTNAHMCAFEALIAPISRVAEAHTMRGTAITLLDAYVGRQAGARIISGQIIRGDTETIRAAIWLSDMRGFTALADTMEPAELIALLNRFFDCQVPAILGHGGEVLKFMGDGLLGIFPIEAGADTAAICAEALSAAREAASALAMLDPAQAGPKGRIDFGLALHVGEALYGNIGGGGRLDFTCIGPAVNMAARLEKLAGSLHRSIVASSVFAAHLPAEFVGLGEFELAGFRAMEKVFGLAEEASAS